jgi:SAM-dependent methyltransferase
MLKQRVEMLDFIYGLKEFTELLTAGWFAESEANKMVKVMDILPAPRKEGRLLQIMAYPYFLSTLVRKFSPFELDVTFHSDEHLMPLCHFNHAIHAIDGEAFSFNPLAFNLERDAAPVPDAFYEGVIFYDVLEHLTENPSFVFSEIHRMLSPGGFLLLTTPNVMRFDNLIRLFRGENIYAPYDGLGAWGRIAREYTPDEIIQLLGAHNFEVQSLILEDISPQDHAHWRTYKSLKELVNLLFPPEEPREMREHIFVVATTQGKRLYAFPSGLFEKACFEETCQGISESLIAGLNHDTPPAYVVTHFNWLLNFITVGFNDHLQLGRGWYEPEEGEFPFRWMAEEGELYLRNDGRKRLLSLELKPPPAEGELRFPELFVGGTRLHRLEKIISLEGGWHRLFFLLSSVELPVIRIIVKSTKTFFPVEIDSSSKDTRCLGLALRHIGSLHGNEARMDGNDAMLLGDGWEQQEYWPPCSRWMGGKATLTLYPLGGERSFHMTYFVPAELGSPLDIHITVGNSQFQHSLEPDSSWRSAHFSLSEPLFDNTAIKLELTRTWSPSRQSPEKKADSRELGIALSSVSLG